MNQFHTLSARGVGDIDRRAVSLPPLNGTSGAADARPVCVPAAAEHFASQGRRIFEPYISPVVEFY